MDRAESIEPIEVEQTSAVAYAIDVTSVPRLSNEALDALPFGVIELDHAGVVQRYNLAEARFARFDRSAVLGRSFFDEVAPCTRTPAFEGRVRRFFDAKPANRPEIASFNYMFDFQFGAQQVVVEMVKCPDPGRICICIGRTRCGDPRSALPEGFPAPKQSELEPRERFQGIYRDEVEQRFVRADGAFLSSMTQTWRQLAPDTWRALSRDWGRSWGQRSLVELEAAAMEDEGRALSELPLETAVALVRQWGLNHGWGEIRCDVGSYDKALIVWVERCAIAEATGHIGVNGCTLLEGWLGAVLGRLRNAEVAVREVGCQSNGADRCGFVLVEDSRLDELETAIATGKASPDHVFALLSQQRR